MVYVTDVVLPLLKQRINCPSAHFQIIDMCNKVYKRCKNFNPEKKTTTLLVITYIYRGYAATHLKGSGTCVGSHLTSIIRMRLRSGFYYLNHSHLPLFSLLNYFKRSMDEVTLEEGFETGLLM